MRADSRMGTSVVITGVGPLTSIGIGAEAFWEGIVSGRSGVRAMEFDWLEGRGFRSKVGAPVQEPDPTEFNLTRSEAQLLDPASRLALEATALALRDAGLQVTLGDDRSNRYRIDGVDAERAGVVIGTGMGGLWTLERSHQRWLSGQPITGTYRYSLPMLIPNASPSQIAIKYGLHGECKAVTTACAAGTMAIGDAYRLVRDGELDFAIAGGVEKGVSDFDGYCMIGFDLLKTLSTRNEQPEKASRPFDAHRDGFVLGEGAAILLLESEAHARARGARVYARLAGYGTTCDAYSMVQLQPSGDQMVRVMKKAIDSSGLSREDIVYVNAHGTSTVSGDAQEAKALHRVFGRRIRDVLVNSTKAMTGHGIGASGGIGAITTALSLARGLVHRCVNLDVLDPECDLSLPRQNQPIRPLAAISNSFAFGGHNATLVLSAP